MGDTVEDMSPEYTRMFVGERDGTTDGFHSECDFVSEREREPLYELERGSSDVRKRSLLTVGLRPLESEFVYENVPVFWYFVRVRDIDGVSVLCSFEGVALVFPDAVRM